MSLPSDFLSDDNRHHLSYHAPPTKPHPHPLRSHSSEDVLSFTSQQIDATIKDFEDLRSDRPDSCVLAHTDDRRGSGYSDRGERDSINVPQSPLPAYTGFRNASTERFGDAAAGFRFPEYTVVAPVRPPLRPTISFGSETRMSYYSISTAMTNDLDMKSKAVAFEEELQQVPATSRVGWRFYASFAILCLLRVVCGMSATALATSLPSIAEDLSIHVVSAFWIANSFLLASTLLQPLSMRLSHVLGVRLLLVLGIAFCTGGSAACGLAKTLPILLLGRAIAGCGSGALGVLTQIILHRIARPKDVPRCERMVSLVYWLGAAVGPVIGGAAVQSLGWRSIFWLNVPFGCFALFTLPFMLQLRTDDGSDWRELLNIDYLGCLFLAGSITPIVVAISWGGSLYGWSSWHTLTPLIIGVVGFAFFTQYSRYRTEPIMPLSILRRAGAAGACFGAVVHGMVFMAAVYLLPVFLQSVKQLNPLAAGSMLSPWTLGLVFAAAVNGLLLDRCGLRWTICSGWMLVTTGTGLLIVIRSTTTTPVLISFGLLAGIGLGMLYPALVTSLQASATTDDETIHAMPLQGFFSTLGQTLGIAVGSSVFLNQQPQGLDDTAALRWVWIVLCAFAGVAFLLNLAGMVRKWRDGRDGWSGHERRGHSIV